MPKYFKSASIVGAVCAITSALFLIAPAARADSPGFTAADQEVIEAMLSQANETNPTNRHVIKEIASVKELHLTANYQAFSENLRKSGRSSDDALKEALEDFLAKNATDTKVIFATNAPQNIQIAPATILDKLFSADHNAQGMGWYLFYKVFPGVDGLNTISRVGMDSKGMVAVIYLGNERRYHAGSGRIHVLRKKDGKWMLQKSELIGPHWVS